MSNELATTAKVSDLADFVKTLQDDAETPTPCKLCNSKFRKEAEELFERAGNVSQVTRFLKEKGEDISNTAVSNHINNHYRTAQYNNNLREFASRLQKWSKLSKDDEYLYNRYIDTLDMEYNHLMAENSTLPIQERRKNTELCLKIAQTIGYYKEQLHKLNIEKRPVEIFVDTLNRIIQVKLQGNPSPEVKAALKEVVDQLNREVEVVPDNA